MKLLNLLAITSLVAALAGCCPQKATPIISCIEKPGMEGLCETNIYDKDLKHVAIDLPDRGRLSEGQEYVVSKPVVVYRVWDKSKDYSEYGNWWTLEKPEGPIEKWRSKYDVCPDPEWGVHDVVSKCLLKVGTKIVIGPGQSVKCKSESMTASVSMQVYIPNKLVNDDVYVESCERLPWP